MKKFLQLVAVFAIALLMAQPAIAGLTCGMGTSSTLPCAPHCPMATRSMRADCQMPRASGYGCIQECCRFGWPQAVVRSVSGARHKAIATPFFLVHPAAASANLMSLSAPPPGDLAAASPPRHILIRVFRI
jgi:hypothetical protein